MSLIVVGVALLHQQGLFNIHANTMVDAKFMYYSPKTQ